MIGFLKAMVICVPISIIFGAITFALVWSLDPSFAPLKQINLTNKLHNITLEDIAEKVAFFSKKRSFFWLDLDKIRQEIKTIPWVFDVKLKRIYPDKLEMDLTELVPIARFNENALVSADGHIFYPKDTIMAKDLPVFTGDKFFIADLAQYYLIFANSIEPLGLRIRQLEISSNGAIKMLLDSNTLVVVGRADKAQRLSRFVLAYKNYIEKLKNKVAYVDLRYTNGVAIGWKTGI